MCKASTEEMHGPKICGSSEFQANKTKTKVMTTMAMAMAMAMRVHGNGSCSPASGAQCFNGGCKQRAHLSSNKNVIIIMSKQRMK